MSGSGHGGREVLRQTLAGRGRKINFAVVAKDIGASVASLKMFAHSGAGLAPDILQWLAAWLYAGASYDVELDALRQPDRKEPIPLGIPPDKWTPGPTMWNKLSFPNEARAVQPVKAPVSPPSTGAFPVRRGWV